MVDGGKDSKLFGRWLRKIATSTREGRRAKKGLIMEFDSTLDLRRVGPE